MMDIFDETADEFDAGAQHAFKWITSHEKPGATGQYVPGFGTNENYSLRIPSNRVTQRLALDDSDKPIVQDVPSCTDDPDLEQLRGELVMGLRRVDSCVYIAPTALVRYAARLVRMNYPDTSKDDMSMLLFNGSFGWAQGIITHALGGPSAVAALQYGDELAGLLLERAKRQQDEVQPAPPPRRFWWRFWRKGQ